MTDYVELRCRSAFSFLRGTSAPEDLVQRAAALGYRGLALGDALGVYGAPRLHRAARDAGVIPIVGAEVPILGHPLLLLCESVTGYRNLCRLLSEAHLTERALGWDDLAERGAGLFALTGGDEGLLAAEIRRGRGAAVLERLIGALGVEHVGAELQIHLDAAEDRRNAAVCALSRRLRVPLVATNDARMCTPDQIDLLDVLDCVRQRVTLAQGRARGDLLRNAERHLKTPAQMAALFRDVPEAIAHTALVAERCGFTLDQLGYRFPAYPLPPGETQDSFLRGVVAAAAPGRFRPLHERAQAQLARELQLIGQLGLSGYFLIVWDLIQFCRARGILVQGRGSAANSAVCFALGITACDPLQYDLLFERFLSEERGEWPDIDLDLPSGSGREQVIQYLYRRYGERACGMTASVITYRGRSAVRDVARVLGLDPGQVAAWGDALDAEGPTPEAPTPEAPTPAVSPEVQRLLSLSRQLLGLPRHLSQHPGGVVLAGGRLDEFVPLQQAAMPGRVVMQWDKDDCAGLGMIKIDLLGLGMMAALQEAQALCAARDGASFDLAALPPDDAATYELIRAADTVGVFQIESRAQMSVLPRLRPRRFYDLVVQVALIRPGPVIGDLVHPYLRRRAGREAVDYAHPALVPVLERTLGVPLFQEQVMRVAMVAAGFTGGQADELRRAMGSRRSAQRMAALLLDLRRGMAARGVAPEQAERIERAITSFAQYGFPESHAISFAHLSYASAYLKAHHPAVFYTALLNAWPMGFYHPATLVRDAARRGVTVLPLDVNQSEWRCALVGDAPVRALRLGLRFVRGMKQSTATALVAARADGPFGSVGDLRARCGALSGEDLLTLAELGALSSLPGQPSRREAVWQVSGLLPGLLARAGEDAPEEGALPDMSQLEELRADYRGQGLSLGPHPLELLRPGLLRQGVARAAELPGLPGRRWVVVVGVVIVRQRPETARGFFFLTLEDETGLCNVIVAPAEFEAQRALLMSAAVLRVEGELQQQDGVTSIKGRRFAAGWPTDQAA